MSGESLGKLLPEVFSLVVETARRRLGQVHYDVQLVCGIEMACGRIAEMKTGEGKTLTAALTAFLWALRGEGLHLVTFNDYLAERDCELLRPVYQDLGLTVGYLKQGTQPHERKLAYRCDITYGAAKEFGFDFLRDRMRQGATGDPGAGVMRGTRCALVDEADSILIDEARTPLIIGMIDPEEQELNRACCQWAAQHAEEFFEPQHFQYDVLKQSVLLNIEGVKLVRRLPQNQWTRQVPVTQLYEIVQNAIKAKRDFHRDKNYTICEGEIVIIDEFTGRPAEGRQWQRGIHQAVQAKERLEITPATQQAATITIQSFFKRYRMFCGMTGTAWSSRRELRKVYKTRVVRIPTHRPLIRKELPGRVFLTTAEKFRAIADSAAEMVAAGRPVLIGTRSVETSEFLARNFDSTELRIQILNANNLQDEAEIIAKAGQSPTVTIATNMAGRGTDIKLSTDIREAGGLHVILSEIHESERIDWQLIGRCSRQGDPGSFQIFVSFEDEILRTGFGPAKARKLKAKISKRQGLATQSLDETESRQELDRLFRIFKKAQRRTERRYLVDRLIVLRNDFEKRKALFETGQDPFLNTVE